MSSSLLSSIHFHDGIKYCDVCTMFGCSELILEPGKQLRSCARQLFDYKLLMKPNREPVYKTQSIYKSWSSRYPFIYLISYTNLSYPLHSKHGTAIYSAHTPYDNNTKRQLQMCNLIIQEGDILKAKPKHFIPRQEGVVSLQIHVYQISGNLNNITISGERWTTSSNCTYPSQHGRIRSSRSYVALPSRRDTH